MYKLPKLIRLTSSRWCNGCKVCHPNRLPSSNSNSHWCSLFSHHSNCSNNLNIKCSSTNQCHNPWCSLVISGLIQCSHISNNLSILYIRISCYLWINPYYSNKLLSSSSQLVSSNFLSNSRVPRISSKVANRPRIRISSNIKIDGCDEV